MATTKPAKAAEEVKPQSILSLSQRPRSLSGLYGQDSIIKSIREHISKRPPRTWLLTGVPGSGKTTLARIMSIAFQCTHSELWGDPCPICWKARHSFSVHDINASKYSGVEEIEKIADLSMHRPMQGLKRVIILDECHALSRQSWSSILTPTEEPPDFTVWILCTSELAKVPVAIQRRCVKYQLKTLSISETEAFLKKYALKAAIDRDLAALIDAVHTMQICAPGLLLQALEKYAAGSSASEATAGADSGSVDNFRICKAVTSGNWNNVKTLLKDVKSDDVRLIRATVSGWLRGFLVRENSPSRCEAAASSMLELSTLPYDESALVNWLYATLFRITQRYGVRR